MCSSDLRIVSGLVLSIGSISCVLDNTNSFADVDVASEGAIVTLGDFHVYVAVAVKEYPEEVYSSLAPSIFDAGLGDDDISFGYCNCDDAELKVYAEVHVVEHAAAGGGIPNSVHEAGEASRYQRNLEADFELLSTPIAPGADAAKAAADLERMRQQIYDKELNLVSTHR